MTTLSKKRKPPRLARWILKWALPKEDAEFLMGDFESIHQSKMNEQGRLSAHRWYWMQAFNTMPGFFRYGVYLRFAFFTHYIKTIFRNLKKHGIHSFINISGLTLGLVEKK